MPKSTTKRPANDGINRVGLGFGYYAIFDENSWNWNVYDSGGVWQAQWYDENMEVSLEEVKDAVAKWNSEPL